MPFKIKLEGPKINTAISKMTQRIILISDSLLMPLFNPSITLMSPRIVITVIINKVLPKDGFMILRYSNPELI